MRARAALLLALMATAALAGEVYTWRDASGKIHYSDTPPPDADIKKLKSAAPESAAPVQTGKSRSLAEQEMEFRKRRAEAEKAQDKAAKDQAAAEQKSRNCEQARAQLQALESGQRMARFNAQGERVYLDDAARAQETAAAQKAVADWCK